MLRTVLYLRFSSDNQREESIEGQRRECTDYANRVGLTIVGEYVDRAFSAKSDERPDFRRMIRDSYKRNYDVILVWKLDRFARNKRDSVTYKYVLSKNNVKVVSATEAIDLDTKEGKVMESLIETFDEYFVDELREKVNRGMAQNILEGKFNGGKATLGYDIGQDHMYHVNESEAGIVTMIFTKYVNTVVSVNQLSKDLNEKGIFNKGKRWSSAALYRVLNNEIYTGILRFHEYKSEGKVPTIIDKNTFDKAHDKLLRNTRHSSQIKSEGVYLLTTKLFCNECGKMMIGDSCRSHTGKLYFYYKCQGAKKHTCNMKPVKKEEIEAAVVYAVCDVLNKSNLLETIAEGTFKAQDHECDLMRTLQAALKDVERKISNALLMVDSGCISDELKTHLNELQYQKTELLKSIGEEEINNPRMTYQEILAMFLHFRELDITELASQRSLINAFVKKIVMYSNRTFMIYFSVKGFSEKRGSLPFSLTSGSSQVSVGAPG